MQALDLRGITVRGGFQPGALAPTGKIDGDQAVMLPQPTGDPVPAIGGGAEAMHQNHGLFAFAALGVEHLVIADLNALAVHPGGKAFEADQQVYQVGHAFLRPSRAQRETTIIVRNLQAYNEYLAWAGAISTCASDSSTRSFKGLQQKNQRNLAASQRWDPSLSSGEFY